MKTAVLALLLGAATIITSCASAIPVPTETHVIVASRQWPGISKQELSAGRDLYILKCSGCHSLYPPNTHTRAEWEKSVPEMLIRAKLTADEASRILRYLVIMSDSAKSSAVE